jgi:hypothetical protein
LKDGGHMSLRRSICLVAFSASAVVSAVAWGHAQAPVTPAPHPPTVFAGSDFGFRVEGRTGNTPTGSLVVRINGQWVDVDFSSGPKRLTR